MNHKLVMCSLFTWILAALLLPGAAEAQFNRSIVANGDWDDGSDWSAGAILPAHDATIGSSAPGAATSSMVMSGAGARTSNGLWMGVFANGTSGTLTMSGGAALNTGFMNLAENSNTTAMLSVTDSSITSGNNLRMAWNSGSSATISLNNSTMSNTITGEGLGRLGGSAVVSLTDSSWSFGGSGEFRNGTDNNASTKSQIILDNGTLSSSTSNFFRNRNATTTSANAGAEIIGNGLISQSSGQAFQNNGRVVASGGTLTLQNFFVMSTLEGLSNVEGGFFGSNGWFAEAGTGNARLVLPGLTFSSADRTWGEGNFAADATPDLVNSVHFDVSGTVTGTLLGSLLATDHSAVPAGLVNPIGVWDFSGLVFGPGGSLQMTFRYDNLAPNLTFDPLDLKLFHHDGSTWLEVAGTVDTANRRFTTAAPGGITSLSHFALAEDFQASTGVPEPGTLALFMVGLVGFALAVRRNSRHRRTAV